MGGSKINKAIFLDRDGVINPNVFNSGTGYWESPHKVDNFEVFPWAIRALKRLNESNYLLFLISNQPSYAKGKTSLDNIKSIHEKFHEILTINKIYFAEYFYCYHHPDGIVSEYSFICECRKPKTLFLEKAKKKYNLNMNQSWIIGDRDTDILCGKKLGVKTILIHNKQEELQGKAGKINPDHKAENLEKAVNIILNDS